MPEPVEEKVTCVAFGASTAGTSFDNAAGLGDATSTPPPTISTNSIVEGRHGFEWRRRSAWPAGPTGSQGPAGKNGKNGKDGKDGIVEFVASGSTAQALCGGDGHLTFQIENKTAGALRGAKVSADSLATKGTDSVAVATIKAGHTGSITLDLRIGRNASLGRHRVKVELKAGGHTVTQTVVVKVTR
jgi:hypothetical protein